MDIKQKDDGSLEWVNTSEGIGVFYMGGRKNLLTGSTSSSASTTNASAQHSYRPSSRIKIPLFNGTANVTGALGVWVSPFNETIMLGRTEIVVKPGQAQSFSISCGTGALSAGLVIPSAAPLGNNLIDSANYQGAKAVTVFNSIDSHGTNGKSTQQLGPGQAIIFTEVSAGALASAGLTAYVEFYKK